MKISVFLFLVSLYLKCTYAQDFDGGCLKPTITKVPNSEFQFDHTTTLGGISKIDKILSIQVKYDCIPLVTCGIFRRTDYITFLRVKYLLKDGTDMTISSGNDKGTSRIVEFREGVYLTGVDYRLVPAPGIGSGGVLVGNMKFYDSEGGEYGPFGESGTPNKSYKRDRSVIKAFGVALTDYIGAGDYVNNFGVYFETNGLYERVANENSVRAQPIVPSVFSDVQVKIPDGSDVVDNTGGTEDLIQTFSFERVVETSESWTIEESSELNVDLTFSAGLSIDVFEGGTEFSIGTSFTNSLETTKTEAIETTVSKSLEVTIPAGQRVTVLFFYRDVVYNYGFDMEVQCFYQFDPANGEDGTFVEGRIFGARAFPNAESVIQCEGSCDVEVRVVEEESSASRVTTLFQLLTMCASPGPTLSLVFMAFYVLNAML